jgi:hypothetical protein
MVAIFQVVGGIVFAVWHAIEGGIPFVFQEVLLVPHLAFALCQASLLGFWAAFSRARWWARLAALLAGGIYLEAFVAIDIRDDDFALMTSIMLVVTAAALLAARWRKADLVRLGGDAPPRKSDAIRFSIRGLMLLTLFVAIATLAAKEFQKVMHSGPVLVFVSGWSLCCALTGLATVWAALSLAAPAVRSAAVLMMSAALGALLAYILNEGWETCFYLTTIMLLYTALLLGSLLVVRSCGYRLTAAVGRRDRRDGVQ